VTFHGCFRQFRKSRHHPVHCDPTCAALFQAPRMAPGNGDSPVRDLTRAAAADADGARPRAQTSWPRSGPANRARGRCPSPAALSARVLQNPTSRGPDTAPRFAGLGREVGRAAADAGEFRYDREKIGSEETRALSLVTEDMRSFRTCKSPDALFRIGDGGARMVVANLNFTQKCKL
jgi:hypothetical protein